MFKYTKYLFSNIFSKKGFWATLLISIITLTIVGLFRIKDANNHGHSAISAMDTQTKFLPFIFGVLITSLVVVYIFKDGIDDGSELMIASKPLNRNRIILGKFFVLVLMIALFQLLIFVDSAIYSQWDDFATTLTKWKFASSLGIGGMIILLIIGSILSFLAIFLSRIGILSLGIVSSAIIPIISAIIAPISKGTPMTLSVIRNGGHYLVENQKLDEFVTSSNTVYDQDEIDPRPATTNEELNDKLKLNHYISDNDSEVVLEKFDDQSQKEQKEYFDTRWYGKFANYDVWYQWSGFYDILMNPSPNSSSPYRWEVEEKVVNMDKKYSLDPSGKTDYSKVFLVMENRSLGWNNFASFAIRDIENEIINNTKDDPTTGEKVKQYFNDADTSFEERLQVIQHIVNHESDALRYDEYLLYKRVVARLKASGEYTEPTHILKSGLDQARTLKQWREGQSFILFQGDHINQWVAHKYIPRSTKVYIWTAIAGFIFLLTVGTYLRRDFK